MCTHAAHAPPPGSTEDSPLGRFALVADLLRASPRDPGRHGRYLRVDSIECNRLFDKAGDTKSSDEDEPCRAHNRHAGHV